VADVGLEQRLAAAAYGLTFYAQKTFVPYPLPLLVHWSPEVSLHTPAFAWRAVAIIAAAALLWVLRRRARALVAATLVYAAFILPVSGLLQAGPQLVAHRYSYLACLPLALLVGAVAAQVWSRARYSAWTAVLLIGLALSAATRAQAAFWHDPLVFCTRAVADSPRAWQPRYALTALHLRAGRWDAAARELQLALRSNPQVTPLLTQATLFFATCPDARLRNGREALLLAERLQRQPGGLDGWGQLAVSTALAATGDYESAQRLAGQAREQARRARLPALAERLADAEEAFSRSQPLHWQPADWESP
jgi:tetratricopeptide (TPR) repeat protein